MIKVKADDNVTKTVSRRMTDAKTYQFTYPDGKTLRKTATGNDLDSIEYNNAEIAAYSRADGVLTAITKGQNLTETFSYNSWNQLANHTINNANATFALKAESCILTLLMVIVLKQRLIYLHLNLCPVFL